MKCRKCGCDLKYVMLGAMAEGMGIRSYPGPLVCTADGGKHDFTEEPKAEAKGGERGQGE